MKLPLFCASLAVALSVSIPAQNAPPLVREVTPRPVSARPTGPVSVSTAESGGLHSLEPLKRLPSFAATTLDGRSSDIGAFRQPKHWLLLYRRENCAACDRMLSTLVASDNALLKGGAALVIVVADNGTHNTNRLDALRAKFTSTTAATWLEDSQGAALKAFKPHGTPMLYALSGDRIQWSMPGVQGDPTLLEKMASSWVNSEDPKAVRPTPPSTTATTSKSITP